MATHPEWPMEHSEGVKFKTGKGFEILGDEDGDQFIALDPAGLTAEAAIIIRDSIHTGLLQHCEEAAQLAVWNAMRNRGTGIGLVHSLLRTLRTLPCLIWDVEIFEAAIAGLESWRESALDKVPLEGVLWFYSSFPTIQEDASELFGLEPGSSQVAVVVAPCYQAPNNEDPREEGIHFEDTLPEGATTGKQGLSVIEIYYSADLTQTVPILRRLPPVFIGDTLHWMAKYQAALSFLELPFVGLERARLSRQVQRQYERKNKASAEFQTVVLRKSSSHASNGNGNSEREYSCQWLVRGHWRKRAERYGPGDPSYVHPYAKGPDGKPFKTPREIIYHAKR